MVVRIPVELAVAEIATQQSELPHVVGNVFADVADGAVGAHDYFLVFFGDLVGMGVRAISDVVTRHRGRRFGGGFDGDRPCMSPPGA